MLIVSKVAQGWRQQQVFVFAVAPTETTGQGAASPKHLSRVFAREGR